MAKKKTASKKITSENKGTISSFSSLVKQYRLDESYMSLLLGLVVVVLFGILAFSFLASNRGKTTPAQSISSDSTGEQSGMLGKTYVVQSGDTLGTIAVSMYGNADYDVELAKANNIQNPDLLEVGMTLKVPVITLDEQGNAIVGQEYTTKEGDQLWEIAVRAYGDGFRWQDIMKANEIFDPENLPPGIKLKIPR